MSQLDDFVELVDLLKGIDARLKRIERSLPKEVASEADLQGKYGNPTARFNPRGWNGEDCKGRLFSDCPAGFLDLYAEAKDFFGEKAEAEGKLTGKGKPAADYERKDAALARGWAAHHRAHGAPVAAAGPSGWAPPDDDIPF